MEDIFHGPIELNRSTVRARLCAKQQAAEIGEGHLRTEDAHPHPLAGVQIAGIEIIEHLACRMRTDGCVQKK